MEKHVDVWGVFQAKDGALPNAVLVTGDRHSINLNRDVDVVRVSRDGIAVYVEDRRGLLMKFFEGSGPRVVAHVGRNCGLFKVLEDGPYVPYELADTSLVFVKEGTVIPKSVRDELSLCPGLKKPVARMDTDGRVCPCGHENFAARLIRHLFPRKTDVRTLKQRIRKPLVP